MRRSLVRKAVSRRRSSSVLKSNSSVSKMSASGRNVIVVPCSSVGSPRVIGPDRGAALVGLRPDVAVAADLGVEPLGQRVDDRHADAVQTAGDLVAAALAELAAGVQHRQHDLEGRLALLLHGRDRDAGAAVDDRDRVVGMDRDLDGVVTAGQRLVNRVVNNLVDEVMQAARSRSSRCTCPGACGPPRVPRAPGCSRRRSAAALSGALGAVFVRQRSSD